MTAMLIEYGRRSERYQGYLSFPPGTARAGCVLVAHDWSGAGALSYAMADALAELGYVGFAIDLYGQGRRGDSPATSAALMQPLIDDRSLIHERFQLAVERAALEPRVAKGALGAIGCCFGGLCVLDMARIGAALRGVVSIHGVLRPLEQAPDRRIRSKVLILHGNEDPWAPPQDLAVIQRELTLAGADWQTHTFGHAMHAFTVPHANDPAAGLLHDAAATARSWTLIAAFLQEALGSPTHSIAPPNHA
jgi:dienelactone hydrolase